MKLTIDRREVQEGLIFKKTCYWLDYNLEMSPEEMQLIDKHKWGDLSLAMYKSSPQRVRKIANGPQSLYFMSAGELAGYEAELIENIRELKSKLEVLDGFASSGPREVEL